MSDMKNEVMEILRKAGIPDAESEALRIISVVKESGQPESAIAMAQNRASGTPLGYITGRENFMGIELIVDPGALIPREETELLGATALAAIRGLSNATPRVMDMCCGSGNLACAIAHHVPKAIVWASDLTDGCVSVARRNVEHLKLTDRVTVKQGDLFAGFAELQLENTIDVIVCNPPYISQGKLAGDRAELLEHEPREAFDGGPYGLSIHQRVIKEALPFLKSGGHLMFEIGMGQERQVKMLFDRMQAYQEIRLVENPEGQIRVVVGQKV